MNEAESPQRRLARDFSEFSQSRGIAYLIIGFLATARGFVRRRAINPLALCALSG